MALTTATATMTMPAGDSDALGTGGSHSIRPRDRAKKAALRTKPERIAPLAPLPAP